MHDFVICTCVGYQVHVVIAGIRPDLVSDTRPKVLYDHQEYYLLQGLCENDIAHNMGRSFIMSATF